MNHVTRAARSAAFAALPSFACALAAACGGPAFSQAPASTDAGGHGGDATTAPPADGGDSGVATLDAATDSGAGANDAAEEPETCTKDDDCASGYCKSGLCEPCSTNSECGAGRFCDLLDHGCKPTKDGGAGCLGAGECTSGFCADAVCCNAACSNTCESCNQPNAVGTCIPVPPGSNAPLRPCPTGDVCCGGGATTSESCVDTQTNTANCGACGRPCVAANQCAAAACNSGTCGVTFSPPGTACDAGKCNGTGVCL